MDGGAPADAAGPHRFDALFALARFALAVPVARFVEAHEGPWLGAGSEWVVEDLAADPRLCGVAPPMDGTGLRAFAGVPVMRRDGGCAGTFCVADRRPRQFSDDQRRRLRDLAGLASALLDGAATWRAARDELLVAREAAAALRASEARWRMLVENGVDTVICWSAERRRIYVSPSCMELLGYAPAEMLGMAYCKMIHPDHLERVSARAMAIQTGEVDRSQSTYPLQHKDGSWVWVDARSRLIRASDGKPSEIITILRDAAERLATEDKLKAGEARHRALADALPQMVWAIAPGNDLATTYTNAQFRAFYGSIDAGQAARVARNHPDDAPALAAAWAKSLATRTPYTAEGRFLRHDGEYRWHRLVVEPVLHGDHIEEWICTALDIHDMVMARQALERSAAFLRLAQGAAGAGLWDWDLRSDLVRHVLPSPQGEEGKADQDIVQDGTITTVADVMAQIDTADHEHLRSKVDHALRSRLPFTVDFRIADKNSSATHWRQAIGRVVCDPCTNEPVRIVGLHVDISARRAAEDALRCSETRLRVSEERLALALDSADEGLWDWDLTAGTIWVSDRWYTMLGFAPGETQPSLRGWRRSVHPDDARQAAAAMRDHLAGRSGSYECENRVKRKDGSYIWVFVRGRVVARDKGGRPTRVVGTQFEISRRKAAEARVEHLALHDALTGLPNRALFRERLNTAYALAQSHRGEFAVLCLDLDRFKEVNDTLGHPAGDALLRVVAERIASVGGPHTTTSRLGGDEFVVLMPAIVSLSDTRRMAERLIAAVGQPILLEGRPVHVGVSIGIAIGPGHGGDADALFKNADIALYKAKGAGRNTWRFYEPGMDAAIAHRKRLEQDMRDALRSRAFMLHYQPVLLPGEKPVVVGFEALLRWQHPTLGPIAPAAMIPLAEESGLIVSIGAWALLQACQTANQWPGDLRIAVNISAVQFRQSGFEETVILALSRSGLAPHRLELEVTESVLMQDGEAVLSTLHRLRSLGIRIALDDFGTGFSSLSYLRRFPFDKIKVDRSFTAAIGEPKTAAIVAAIIGLGQPLGAIVTAEGVETAAQHEKLLAMGCNEVQGFLFSLPMPDHDVRDFLQQEAARIAA